MAAEAYDERSPQMVFLKNDWDFDAIRSDARFEGLLERMRFRTN